MDDILKKKCIICEEEKDLKKFDYGACGRRRNICETCRNLRKRAALWIHFLRAFDFKCQCCGEDDIRFLTVDHINNDGKLDRQNRNTSDNIPILREAKDLHFDKTKYTCLCWNCNCGKARNKGICPHKGIDKYEYKRFYLRTGQMKISRQVYNGDLKERNSVAQSVFRVNRNIENMSQEDVLKLVELLKSKNI